MSRVFQSSPARRKRVPLLLGIAGMAGSGKTYSALRLARGMITVVGGRWSRHRDEPHAALRPH